MKLEGHTGGHVLDIDARGHAQVDSITRPAIEEAARRGLAFSWSNVTYNYSAADTILLVQNTNTGRKLHMSHAIVSGDTATEVRFHYTDKTALTPAGTAVIGVALNNVIGGTPTSIAKGDETANTQGNIFHHQEILAATPTFIDMRGAVILGLGQSVAVDYVTVGATCFVTMWGYYETEAV